MELKMQEYGRWMYILQFQNNIKFIEQYIRHLNQFRFIHEFQMLVVALLVSLHLLKLFH
jgi:hypothetical protein